MTKFTDHGFKPGGYLFFDIQSINISQWSPDPSPGGPVTQVHLGIRISEIDYPLIARFKGPETLGVLIEQLTRHRREVWPDAPPIKNI